MKPNFVWQESLQPTLGHPRFIDPCASVCMYNSNALCAERSPSTQQCENIHPAFCQRQQYTFVEMSCRTEIAKDVLQYIIFNAGVAAYTYRFSLHNKPSMCIYAGPNIVFWQYINRLTGAMHLICAMSARLEIFFTPSNGSVNIK